MDVRPFEKGKGPVTDSAAAFVSRRSFLRTAAAAAGALGFPALIPAGARGADGRPAPSNRITVGCIGVGGMGTGNMHSFLGLSDVQVVAVCDVHAGAAARAKEAVDGRYGNRDCAVFRDFRELVARGDIDAVSIATPDHWHALPAIAAARAGKDIYCEKPMAHTLREGRAIADAVRRHGRIWQTGSWQRSQRDFRFACELVRNGRVGRVHTIEVGLPSDGTAARAVPWRREAPPAELDYEFWLGPAPALPYMPEFASFNWRWNRAFGGGSILDWCGHHVDIAHWGMGWDLTGPVELEGRGEFQGEGIFDTAHRYRITTKYRDGTVLVMAGNDGLAGGTKWIGDRGWVRVDRGVLEAEPKDLLREQFGSDEIRLFDSPGHHRNFIDCVRSRRATITPAEVAHRSASAGHLGQIAMLTGRKLRWDPDAETFADDAGATQLLGHAMRSPWAL